MKKIIFFSCIILILVFVGLWWFKERFHGSHTTSPSQSEKNIEYYTCSMHPWVRSDKPGTCPACGMNLVPVYKEGAEHQHPETLSETMGEDHSQHTPETQKSAAPPLLRLSPEKQQLIGIKTESVTRRVLTREIFAAGRVAYDPDLYVAQAEYLIVERGGGSLSQAARSRLKLLGMSEAQIRELGKRGRPQGSLLVPKKGDLVWIYGSIFESDLSWVKPGMPVKVLLPNSAESWEASIESIDPTIDPTTRTARVRFRIANPDSLGGIPRLKPDMYLKAVIEARGENTLTIPDDAILDTGIRQIAFVDKGEGRFEVRELKIGNRGSGYTEILSGLSEGEIVVTRANFLMDSESSLKATLTGMGGHQH